ncbi:MULTISPECIES: IS5/IS1182 family transposase [Bosea]|jgi:transposase|uniref:IS5/IS1182 family transposase n=1 Tax=Bosea TaxID=85413 RepID=UPI0006BAFE04
MLKPARTDLPASAPQIAALAESLDEAGGPILSERQWLWLSQRLPLATEKRGRPPRNNRIIIEGIFWVASSGQPWRDLPGRYGKWGSVYRRFQRWSRSGVFAALMQHVRPFECGPQAADAETRRLFERLAIIGPLTQRPRKAPVPTPFR